MGGAQKPMAMSPELRRIAEKAREDHRIQFTSLAHLLTVEALEAAWKALKKRSSAGVDGVTAAEYERDLRRNLERLHEQLRAGQYVAPPGPELGQPHPEDPIPAREPGSADGALQDRQLMAEREVLDGNGGRPRRARRGGKSKDRSRIS